MGGCSSSQLILYYYFATTSPVTVKTYIFREGRLPLLHAAVLARHTVTGRLLGEFSLWKYLHLQAVLRFHRLTACLSGISSCWKHHTTHTHTKKKNHLNSELSTSMSSDSILLPIKMQYVQFVFLLKAFLVTSFIDGRHRNTDLIPTVLKVRQCVCASLSNVARWNTVNQIL